VPDARWGSMIFLLPERAGLDASGQRSVAPVRKRAQIDRGSVDPLRPAGTTAACGNPREGMNPRAWKTLKTGTVGTKEAQRKTCRFPLWSLMSLLSLFPKPPPPSAGDLLQALSKSTGRCRSRSLRPSARAEADAVLLQPRMRRPFSKAAG